MPDPPVAGSDATFEVKLLPKAKSKSLQEGKSTSVSARFLAHSRLFVSLIVGILVGAFVPVEGVMLGLLRPADVADQHRDREARQRPHAEDVAAADLVGDRLVDQPELEPGLRVRRLGHEAGGQRAGDPPLVLELQRVRDRAGGADARARRAAAGRPRRSGRAPRASRSARRTAARRA